MPSSAILGMTIQLSPPSEVELCSLKGTLEQLHLALFGVCVCSGIGAGGRAWIRVRHMRAGSVEGAPTRHDKCEGATAVVIALRRRLNMSVSTSRLAFISRPV